MITTRLTQLLGLEYPIVSAPMARMSGGNLAGAVSAAGGLGTFGAASLALRIKPQYVREQIAAVRAHTDRPFGVGFLTHNIPSSEENFEAALEQHVPVMLFSFGDPTPWLRKAKQAGIKTICQVQSMEDADRAASGGADVLAVQGQEAGGHCGPANLLPFLVRAVEEFPQVPVIAAGGISSGRALAAVLAAGAEGAWMGTLFTAVVEADEMSAGHKEAVVLSDGRDTVRSKVFDIMNARAFGDLPWPSEVGFRVKRNAFLDEWLGREMELSQCAGDLAETYVNAFRTGDTARAPFIYGEAAGQITAVRPAADAIAAICSDAEQLIRERARLLS
ncbi:MAG: nitronate monooxygenase [Acidimicrobiia bacterium]|jgi:nitronate monooxygenase|nr:nitronate monooxygenase [Acidimicrobiia bacterium]